MRQGDEVDASHIHPLLNPLLRTGWGFYLSVILLGAVVAWGVRAWLRQLWLGLGVTGMNTPVYWGVYITNFVFFIGISHAGTLISAILRLTGSEWRRPITRAAEAITVFALIAGAMQIVLDLGRPERILNVFPFGRSQSPLMWDVLCIGVYLLSCSMYLYLPLIPDLALLRDTLERPGWRKSMYRVLSLGWQGTPEQRRRLNKAISGMAIIRKVSHLEAYLKALHFTKLGWLLIVMCGLWFYATFAEYLTTGYGAIPTEMRVFNAKLAGEFAWLFWGMVGAMALAFLILVLPHFRANPIKATVAASALILVAMWLERFTIVVPTGTRPMLEGYPWGIYHPTWVEWSLTAASLAGMGLLYVLFSKLFPIISIWEVEEAREAIPEVTRTLESYLPETA